MDMVRATGDTEPALSMPGMGDHPTAMAMYGGDRHRALPPPDHRRGRRGLAPRCWPTASGPTRCQVQAALCGYELTGRGAARPARRDGRDLHDRRRPLVHPHHHQPGPRLAAAGRGDRPAGVAGGSAASPRRWPASPTRDPAGQLLERDLRGRAPGSTGATRLDAGGVTFGIVGQVDRPHRRPAARSQRPAAGVRRRLRPAHRRQPVPDRRRDQDRAAHGARHRPAHAPDPGGVRRARRRPSRRRPHGRQ